MNADPSQVPNPQNEPDFRAVVQVLDRIGSKWTVMAVGTLKDGPMRFNAIMRAIDGVSHRMLTLTLRSLVQDGLVKRTAYATIPPKVEYELTEPGRSLIEPLGLLVTWIKQNHAGITAARTASADHAHAEQGS